MCGILGTVNIPFDREPLDLIHHRGPDGEGILRVNVGAHQVQLGHRRLAIVDLSPAGAQPMQTPCGNAHLVFNGEIYNHQELRRGLRNTCFRGHSDTETVLHLLSERGEPGLSHLNGIFGLAFLDRPGRRLILARDPFGVKPVYYWRDDESLIFSSELEPILHLRDDELDTESLAQLLRLRYLPAPDTLFKKIRKIRPGHALVVDLSGCGLKVTEKPYESAYPPRTHLAYKEAVAEYHHHLDRAVQRQLMSDVDVGVLLSGGVDSALVAATAQKHTAYRMRAFTVGFLGREEADEIQEARVSARVLGLEHRTVRIGFNDFLRMLRECIRIVEEPLATTSLLPMYYLAQRAAADVKVVLSGQGADETLGGYGRHQGEVLRQRVPGWLFAALRPIVRWGGLRNGQIQRGADALRLSDYLERFLKVYEVFNTHEIKALTGADENIAGDRIRYFVELLGCDAMPTGAERMMALDARMSLSDDLLLYTDKIAMHHSLECRVPMLDLDLVRFVESLPVSYRLRYRCGKRILKDCARSVLPRVIVDRKKNGFEAPTQRWFTDAEILREILLDKSSVFSRYVDTSVVPVLLKEHARGYDRQRHIFLLLCLRYWMDQFIGVRRCRTRLYPRRRASAYHSGRQLSHEPTFVARPAS